MNRQNVEDPLNSTSLTDGLLSEGTTAEQRTINGQSQEESIKNSDGGDVSESSSLERSYEILNDSLITSNSNKKQEQKQQVTSSRMESGERDDTQGIRSSADFVGMQNEARSTSMANNNGEPRNDSATTTHEQIPPAGRRKSGSFLSKLTSSGQDNKATDASSGQNSFTNLPSSFANLISSVSFTSGFRGSNTPGGGGVRESSSSDRRESGSFLREHNASKLTIETASNSTGVSSSATTSATETRDQIVAKKATIERKNLINLTKLIVKDLISSSLSLGRTIDDHHQCAIHLNNYFTLLDRVLKHGLKQQNILSNRSANLWSALDNLPRYLTDKRLTSETVRSLAHTKTPDGRIKAWLRIAMMQKKLPEYFNELLANKNVLLKDIYHEFAFMLNDEAQVFAGLIIGVNVIDCNFFVKDDNFDLMDEVIDLGPYMRAANAFDEDDQKQAEKEQLLLAATASAAACETGNNLTETMTAVLDQKNYLEERSLHLETTVESLRAKIRHLEELNGRLEMDAKLNEVRIEKLQRGDSPTSGANTDKLLLSGFPIPDALKSLMNPSMGEPARASSSQPPTSATEAKRTLTTEQPPTDQSGANGRESQQFEQSAAGQQASETPTANDNAEQQSGQLVAAADLERAQRLAGERERELVSLRERVAILETSYRGALEKIRALERDVESQTAMNSHKESTINTYEREMRDKQFQLESLRNSLGDAKKLNAELNERLNDTGAKLKDRLNTVTSLQSSLDKWKLENKQLAIRFQDKLTALKTMSTQLDQSLKTISELKKYNEKINDDLRRERECGQTSSITVEEQTNKIGELTNRLTRLEGELKDLRPYRDQMVDLKKRCQEYELSLEEVGYQLRASREEVESLKENSSVFLDSQWMDSKQVKACALCQQAFSVTRRKHHCRLCGNVFCQTCSDNKMELASSAKPVRVCDTCHAFLLAKFIKSTSASINTAAVSSSASTPSLT